MCKKYVFVLLMLEKNFLFKTMCNFQNRAKIIYFLCRRIKNFQNWRFIKLANFFISRFVLFYFVFRESRGSRGKTVADRVVDTAKVQIFFISGLSDLMLRERKFSDGEKSFEAPRNHWYWQSLWLANFSHTEHFLSKH